MNLLKRPPSRPAARPAARWVFRHHPPPESWNTAATPRAREQPTLKQVPFPPSYPPSRSATVVSGCKCARYLKTRNPTSLLAPAETLDPPFRNRGLKSDVPPLRAVSPPSPPSNTTQPFGAPGCSSEAGRSDHEDGESYERPRVEAFGARGETSPPSDLGQPTSRRKASTSLGESDSREGSEADESHLLQGGSASKQAPILPEGQSETD